MLNDIDILKKNLHWIDKDFQKILEKIPKQDPRDPHPYWAHSELIERYRVLKTLNLQTGMNILEVGCGAHALSTIPLAHFVGNTGRIIAVDQTRWRFFEKMVTSSNLHTRIIPLKIDITQMINPYPCFDMGVIIHGIRSLGEDPEIIQILQGLLHNAKSIGIAESLPIANNPAQQAHLDMYNLRAPIFEAIHGKKDDLPYRTESELIHLMESAGAQNITSRILKVRMPHYLSYFPKEIIFKIADLDLRNKYLREWQKAAKKLHEVGEEHPPVCIITGSP